MNDLMHVSNEGVLNHLFKYLIFHPAIKLDQDIKTFRYLN
jgi:hypothetical protein